MKVLGNILAGFMSIIYFLVLFIMMILVFASNVFSVNYYKEILKEIDLSEIKLADFGITSFGNEFFGDASVEDILVQSLNKVGISKNDAMKIVENEKITEIVAPFISDAVNYVAGNQEIPQFKYQEVKDVFNSSEISSVLQEVPNDQEIEQFVDEINEVIITSLEGFSYGN